MSPPNGGWNRAFETIVALTLLREIIALLTLVCAEALVGNQGCSPVASQVRQLPCFLEQTLPCLGANHVRVV